MDETLSEETQHTALHGETPGTTTATEVWAGLKPDGLEEIPPDLDDVASVAINEAPCHWAMWADREQATCSRCQQEYFLCQWR